MAKQRARNKAGRFAARIYGARRSQPGDPPYKQTGLLRSSVTHEVIASAGGIVARIGTNLKYGLYQELGTNRGIAPRPWLRRALDESRAEIAALFR
ncbi:MAG: hypothetical protein U0790_00145 [Isosphaeraceae bacterium]